MRVVLDEGAKLPTRANEYDAGLDLYAREDKTIPPRGYGIFDTGVHAEIPVGTFGLLVSKSGLNVNHGLTSTGAIDSGYTGAMCVRLDNHSDTPYEVKKGDKISQLIIIPCIYAEPEIVDRLDKTSRGSNGFGSSGR